MGSPDNWYHKVPVQNEDVAWRIVDEECIIIQPETSQATVVVIITVIIAAVFLQIFDFFWSKVTGYILG